MFLNLVLMIPQETIQQIQSRIDIIDIVGGFVKLKKRGANYLGLCPFHNEKTPSFTVSPSKEIYKCFGCGKSGNGINFIMEHEKYSYPEALKWLAARYNIEIEEEYSNPEQRLQQQTADSLYILNKFAQDFFSGQLWENEEGQIAGLGYLRERGFSDDIMQKFQIGYCPEDGFAFSTAATGQQYNAELLVKSGLSVSRDNRLQDNYRGRIIFPIHNQSGKIIGFGARIIRKNDRAPKYINTPENEIYVKSRILYGMYFARQAIDRADECLLVEGYTDVIALQQAGIENVVASGGTSLTTDQLRLIRKFTQNLTIVYDGDSAGIKAASRGLDLALEEGLNVRLVLIPDNEDPDSYVRKVGAPVFREFIVNSRKDVILFQMEVAMKDAGDDPSKKSAAVNQIAETISRINKTEDFSRQQDYIHRCADLLKVDEEKLTALVNKHIRDRVLSDEKKGAIPPIGGSPIPEPSSQDESWDILQQDELQERAVVRCLLEFGNMPWDESRTVAEEILSDLRENGLDEMFDHVKLLEVIKLYEKWYDAGMEPTEKNFLYHNDHELSQLVISLEDNTSLEISPNWVTHFESPVPSRKENYLNEVIACMSYLKLKKIRRLIRENQKDLEKEHSPSDQMTLLETHQHLKKMEMELAKKVGTVIFK